MTVIDPFDELEKVPRKMTIADLTGEKLKLWKEFVRRHKRGEFNGVANKHLFLWAKAHLGISIGKDSFKRKLDEAAGVADAAAK
jgi:hypothetical protein